MFDLFHTLVDPEDFRPKDFNRASEIARLFSIDAEGFSKYWLETRIQRNSTRTRVVVHLEEYLRRQKVQVDPVLLAAADDLLGRYQDLALLGPRPEIESVVKRLNDQGTKLGLLTNCDEREVREWPRSPLSKFIYATSFSFSTGFVKPSIEAYSSILDKLGVVPADVVYVGDGGSDELLGARNAGFGLTVFSKQFVSTNGLRKPSEIEEFSRQADWTITRLEELFTDTRLTQILS